MKFTLVAAAIAIAASSVSAMTPAAGCTKFHTVVKGDSCEAVAAANHITVSKLVSLNHGLHWGPGHYCDNLDVGKKYCVKDPKKCAKKKAMLKSKALAAKKSSKKTTKKTTKKHTTTKKKATTTKKSTSTPKVSGDTTGPIAHRTIASCKTYHLVTDKDSCTSLISDYHISAADFYKWNPGVHHAGAHQCDNLDTGKRYCVKA
ncbi:hypothetical protein BGW37DRAFT_499881 [Umbelopsis sp. PMI_123]|nr:hypothetical protein BGW37DRAFT_499881 [Umbelopsis sp. PMI_123]